MKIITISGLDGSGKSTQVRSLRDYLEKKGHKVYYFHAIEFGLANKLSKEKKDGASPKSVVRASRWTILLRKLFLMIDLWRFRKLFGKLAVSGYNYIISDRYFYDTLINIAFLEDAAEAGSEKAILRPDTALYLKADPANIMQRDRKPDQGIDYLRKKEALYDRAALAWKLVFIDGNQDPETVFQSIIQAARV